MVPPGDWLAPLSAAGTPPSQLIGSVLQTGKEELISPCGYKDLSTFWREGSEVYI